MLRIKKIAAITALFTVVFGASFSAALSYLSMADASSMKIAQGLKQKAEAIDEENNLKFVFQDCKRSNQTIICNVLVTNLKSENQQIRFDANDQGAGSASRVVDVSGNEYIGQLVKLGQKEDSSLTTQLVGGVSTKISFSFQVPKEVTKLTSVEFRFKTFGSKVQAFHDINIEIEAFNPSME